MFGATQSGNFFRDRGRIDPEYNMLIEPPLSDNEGVVEASL